MSLPNRPDRRSPLSADTLARMIEETSARTLQSASPAGLVHHRGKGVMVMRRPSWTNTVRVTRGMAYPFDILISGTTATFRAGTINGYLPTNYLTGVTIPGSGTRYLVLNCTASNGQITAATFSADVAQPAAITPYLGQPPIALKVLIGLSIDGAGYKVWGNGNIQADPIESFRVDKASPTAGKMPYDIYYGWTLRLL